MLLGRVSGTKATVWLHEVKFSHILLRRFCGHFDAKFTQADDGELCLQPAVFIYRILRDYLFFRALRLRATKSQVPVLHAKGRVFLRRLPHLGLAIFGHFLRHIGVFGRANREKTLRTFAQNFIFLADRKCSCLQLFRR